MRRCVSILNLALLQKNGTEIPVSMPREGNLSCFSYFGWTLLFSFMVAYDDELDGRRTGSGSYLETEGMGI